MGMDLEVYIIDEDKIKLDRVAELKRLCEELDVSLPVELEEELNDPFRPPTGAIFLEEPVFLRNSRMSGVIDLTKLEGVKKLFVTVNY